MFNPQIRTKSLALACRALSTMLDAGVPIQRSFAVAAEKTGDIRCRNALQRIAEAVGRGEEVADAMRAEEPAFPDLMTEMIRVAEQAGALPEILKGLAEHYDSSVRLRRQFISSIIWPALQFTIAVFLIAFLIFILGAIAQSRGGQPIDVLGFGLSGAKGAFMWLAMVGGTLLSLFTAYQIIARSLRGKKTLHGLLLQLPVVGNCMRSFAIARFSWAFYLTQQTGMPIEQCLQSSLRATNNGAFIAAGAVICGKVNDGESLTDALAAGGVFPPDFLSMVDVAEQGGTVPEALHRLSPQFEEQAQRSLSVLTTMLGYAVWATVAIFIIFLIFRIVFWYVGMINDAVQQTM